MNQLPKLIGSLCQPISKPKSFDELNNSHNYYKSINNSTTATSATLNPIKTATIKPVNKSNDTITLWDLSAKESSTEYSVPINFASTINNVTTVKPILKIPSTCSSTSASQRHKRCSSLGQSIRYIDEASPQSLLTSPLTPLTCPSTPNAYQLSPTSQSTFNVFPSTSPTATLVCDCQQCDCSDNYEQDCPNLLKGPTSTSASNCVPLLLANSDSVDGNHHSHHHKYHQQHERPWYQRSSLRSPSSTSTIGQGAISTSNQNLGRCCCECKYQRHQHGNNHIFQGRALNSLDPSASLLPPLASVESVTYTDHPMINSRSSSHNHHHHNNNESVDRQSLYSIHMEKDFRYFFQHPYARLLVAYSVIACNFLIFAEDPISHSHTECKLPIVGNVISFVFTKYPPETVWRSIKVILWLTAIMVGMVIGKYLVHHVVLRRILRLKMFRDEEGTWMIMILITFISCYIFSLLYNGLLLSAHPSPHRYLINTQMGVSNASFMKVAACGTWLGDFFTAWMVTDMMLQDELYPAWARGLRRFWSRHGLVRIVIFWAGSIGISALVIYLISSDDISWDNLNHNYVNTTELTRALLASIILVMDLLVVMQDWDFPHFVCDLDIKLPGLKQASYTFKIFTIKKSLSLPETFVFHITGKWFNYGIIIVVMMLDLNMWKNQIFYNPTDYGQYTGPDRRVYTVSDPTILLTGNSSLWTYAARASTIDPVTNRSLLEGDLVVNSRYLGYPIYVKSLAFLPCAAGFILFSTLIYQYGRFPPKTDASYGGRLKKRRSTSSWRRERRDSRHGYISWKGITTYEEEPDSYRKQIEDNSNV